MDRLATSRRRGLGLLAGALLTLLPCLGTLPVAAGPEHAADLFDLTEPPATEATLPWNEGIYATTFAVSGTPRSGLGHVLEGATDFFVALPAVRDELPCLDGRMMARDREEGTITCRVIEIRPYGKPGPVVEATVEDIGPWTIRDPYWLECSRPLAESGRDDKGRETNLAGIDMSPALRKALGLPRSARVDWRFKTDAAGNVITRTRKEAFRT